MKLRFSTIATNVLGAIIFVSLAGGATLLAMSKPGFHWQKTTPSAVVGETPAPQPTPEPAPVATSTPAPTPAPEPVPVPAPAVKTATTNAFVHMRRGPSTATDILVDLQGDTIVTLLDDSNSQWQQVKYGNLTGYIFKSYLAY